MGKNISCLFVFLLIVVVFSLPVAFSQADPPVKISIFNFHTVNMEASGYGTTVTNMLLNSLSAEHSLNLLDRKELETFLNLNDLQQNDNLDNVVNIGTRLGLDVIVAGSVEKKSSVIAVTCKVINIEKKKIILDTQIKSLGDVGLTMEIKKLSSLIAGTISNPTPKHEEAEEASMAAVPAISPDNTQGESVPAVTAEPVLNPKPPVILNTEGYIRSVRLMFSPASGSDESPIKLKGFKVYRAKAQQGPFAEIANVLFADLQREPVVAGKKPGMVYIDRHLGDGEECYYKLKAYNEVNLESDFSDSVKGASVRPVSDLEAQGDLIREVVLTWSPIESLAVKGYNIYRGTSENGNFAKIKKLVVVERPEKKLQYADRNGLGDGMQYHYKITAFDDKGTETPPSITVSTLTKAKPPVPRGLTAKSGMVKKVELSWTPSLQEEVVGYNLYWSSENSGKCILLKKVEGRMMNSFIHDTLGDKKIEDNATIYYAMTSFNRGNVESELTETVTATTKPKPSKPSGLKGEALKIKEVPLSWEPNPEKDIAFYHIYRSSDSKEDFLEIWKIQEKKGYIDKGLEDGCTYSYKLQVEDKDGLLSDFSDTISVQTKTKPPKPVGLTGELRKGKIRLVWKAVNEPDIDHYVVYGKSASGLIKITTVKKTNYSETKPAKGTEKIYAVSSVDKDGLESEISEEATVIHK